MSLFFCNKDNKCFNLVSIFWLMLFCEQVCSGRAVLVEMIPEGCALLWRCKAAHSLVLTNTHTHIYQSADRLSKAVTSFNAFKIILLKSGGKDLFYHFLRLINNWYVKITVIPRLQSTPMHRENLGVTRQGLDCIKDLAIFPMQELLGFLHSSR